MLATFAQSQASVHISTLAHQVRPVSHAALALVRQQGLDLAVQDAFWLSLAAFVLAFIAVCFIQVRRPVQQEQAVESTANLAGEVVRG